MKWTQQEDNLLAQLWENAPETIIASKFPNRSWNALCQRAAKLRLKRKYRNYKTCNFNFLDLESITKNSAYWWGFIIADGYLGKKNLQIKIQEKDRSHLEKIAMHLGNCNIHNVTETHFNKRSNLVYINIAEQSFITNCKKKLELTDKNTKTYFPPNLNLFYNKDLLIYFLIGFIDGDGCISVRKRGKSEISVEIKIECHINWRPIFDKISELLLKFYNIKSYSNFRKDNSRSGLFIYSKKCIQQLYKASKDVDSLNRKWDKLQNVYGENL